MLATLMLAGTAGAGVTLVAAVGGDPSSNLLNYGVAGVVGALAIALVYRVLTRMEKQNDALQARIDERDAFTRDTVYPLLGDGVAALKAATDLMTTIRAEERVRWEESSSRPPPRRRSS